MRSSSRRRLDAAAIIGLPLTIVVLIVAQWLEGGRLQTLAQPTAAVVVFGGTAAALLVSFPFGALRRSIDAAWHSFTQTPMPARSLISQFTQYAIRARRKGVMALENEIASASDPFLSRALALSVDGFGAADVRHALEIDSRLIEDAEEESAAVFESAAGYAPTLGILGAVLGLIQVMENLAAPGKLGEGIAVAFVATVYGVGSANLLFLPLATKLRTQARAAALTRELIIEGMAAVQQSMHPRLVEQHLSAFVRASDSRPKVAA